MNQTLAAPHVWTDGKRHLWWLGIMPLATPLLSGALAITTGVQELWWVGVLVIFGLIYGSRDKVLDFRKHGQALADKVPGLKMQVIEGRGHMLPITATERVAALVEQVAKRSKPVESATVLHPPFALASK